MSIIKQRFRQNAQALQTYLTKDRECIVAANYCNPELAAQEFRENQRMHNKVGVNQTMHIVQSWSHEESKKLTPLQAQEMGLELAKRAYPNHLALVVTHTDEKHLHNHIMVDPVNFETGKRVWHKISEENKTRGINDQLMRDRGLSVVTPKKRTHLSSKSIMADKHRGKSTAIDLKEKALFAQKYARNYGEHKYIMEELGIEVPRITKKTITYKYPGMQRGKRGDKLDPSLTNNNMKIQFEENSRKYKGENLKNLLAKDARFHKYKDEVSISKEDRAQEMKEIVRTKYKNYVLDTAKKHIYLKEKESVLVVNEKGNVFSITKKDKEFNVLRIKASWESFKNSLSLKSQTVFFANSKFMAGIGKHDLSKKGDPLHMLKIQKEQKNDLKGFSTFIKNNPEFNKVEFLNNEYDQQILKKQITILNLKSVKIGKVEIIDELTIRR